MYKFILSIALFLTSFHASAMETQSFILEIMWDDAVTGSVDINGENIWKFPLTSQEEKALKNLPSSVKERLNIHSFDAEDNIVRLYANDLFQDKINTLKYTYKKHTDEYIRYRPSRLGYYLYTAENIDNKDSWILVNYDQQPIDQAGKMEMNINPYDTLVTFYIDNFTPMTDEMPSVAENVRAIYRELTVELMNGDFTSLNTLNPSHKLRFELFRNKALLNNNQLSCRRGERTEARVRFIGGAAFVIGELASCTVITKDGKKEQIQFDYFQYQFNGKDWELADFLVRHPNQESLFPDAL